jgi:hypothetical protein
VKRAAWFILVGLLAGASGCASRQSLGDPIDNAVRRSALLGAYPRPDVSKAVFRTLIRWGKREISLTEIVKPSPEGGLSVVGITDIGSTLYAAKIAPDGHGQVLSKSLPFSNRWLLEELVADLIVPWNGPSETAQLYRQPDGNWALVCNEQRTTRVFVFNAAGTWQRFDRLKGSRLLSRTVLEWDEAPLPKIMRTDDRAEHYHVIRERIAGR